MIKKIGLLALLVLSLSLVSVRSVSAAAATPQPGQCSDQLSNPLCRRVWGCSVVSGRPTCVLGPESTNPAHCNRYVCYQDHELTGIQCTASVARTNYCQILQLPSGPACVLTPASNEAQAIVNGNFDPQLCTFPNPATPRPTTPPITPTNPPSPTNPPAPTNPPPPTILPTPTSTPPVTVNNPTGNTDLANCSVIAGWSCDRDNPDAQIQVAVFNGPYNPSDTSNFLGYFPANVGGGNGADSEAIAAACGSTNANIGHRFVVTFPQEWVNGQVYNIHVYGINIGGGQNVLIGSPISVNTATCLASPTATPTTAPSPTPSGACQLVRAYRPTGDLGIASNWGSPLTTAQLMQLRAGDTVYFTVVGNVTGGSITAGRIRVNASTWSTRDVTTSFKPNAVGVDSSIREYYRAYVVPANTYSFTVGAEIYSPALDTNTNMNDGNLGWR